MCYYFGCEGEKKIMNRTLSQEDPNTDTSGLPLVLLIEVCDLVTAPRLTCSLVPSYEHICSHHAAHAQDADHDADEMHSLVPDQQEEPGEQNHHRDHETVQELLGASRETRVRVRDTSTQEKVTLCQKVLPWRVSAQSQSRGS